MVSAKKELISEGRVLVIKPQKKSLAPVPPTWCFLNPLRVLASVHLWPAKRQGRVVCLWLLVGDIPWTRDPLPKVQGHEAVSHLLGEISLYSCPLKLCLLPLCHPLLQERVRLSFLLDWSFQLVFHLALIIYVAFFFLFGMKCNNKLQLRWLEIGRGMSEHLIDLLTELGWANLKVIQPSYKFSRQLLGNFCVTKIVNWTPRAVSSNSVPSWCAYSWLHKSHCLLLIKENVFMPLSWKWEVFIQPGICSQSITLIYKVWIGLPTLDWLENFWYLLCEDRYIKLFFFLLT